MTKPGLYRHNKSGDTYCVLYTAINTTNGDNDGQILVVYMKQRAGHPIDKIYAREERQFHEIVDGKPRFEPIGVSPLM